MLVVRKSNTFIGYEKGMRKPDYDYGYGVSPSTKVKPAGLVRTSQDTMPAWKRLLIITLVMGGTIGVIAIVTRGKSKKQELPKQQALPKARTPRISPPLKPVKPAKPFIPPGADKPPRGFETRVRNFTIKPGLDLLPEDLNFIEAQEEELPPPRNFWNHMNTGKLTVADIRHLIDVGERAQLALPQKGRKREATPQMRILTEADLPDEEG